MHDDAVHPRFSDLQQPVSRSNRSGDTFHTFCLNPARHWRRLRRLHSAPDRDFADRVRSISIISPLMEASCAVERFCYARTVRETQIVHSPVFVIGHWRSGTTLLHNALCKDPQFGYVTLFQTLAPGSFLIGRKTLQPLLALRAPNSRPMDNVKIRMGYPSEEEFAIAHQCPQSPYLGFTFPRDWRWLFEKYGLMRGISGDDRAEWACAYREIAAKATLNFGGRRLVLKNPVNTARMPAIREVFPGAKFIHIYRNPYDVFRSTLHLHREVHKVISLQCVSDKQLIHNVLDFYTKTMRAYWDQSPLVPESDRVDVRYEDFISDPLAEIQRVYRVLGLPGWETARGPMERFLSSRAKYQLNRYEYSPDERELVERHWGEALDRLGYRVDTSAAAIV